MALAQFDIRPACCDMMMAEPLLDTAAQAARLRQVSVLSTFAPSIDGIARYADQLVNALEKEGARVKRIGLAHWECGGDEMVDVLHGARFLRVVRHTPRGHAILVMWHEHYLAPGRQLDRILSICGLAAGFRLRRTIVVQHEPDPDLVSGVRGLRRPGRLVEEWLRQVMWQGAAEIWFHSEYELDEFRRRYPAASTKAKLSLVSHGTTFVPEVTISRAEARRTLGVPLDEQMFVSVGFLAERKGVDIVARAFLAAAPDGGRLWIVGAAIGTNQETQRHIAQLHAAAAANDNIEMSERYLDNVEFDMWLTAADYVVLAYRTAASSSVIPRAQLLGARIIGSGAGGTAEQMRPGIDIVAPDEASLAAAFRAVSARPDRSTARVEWPDSSDEPRG